MELSNFLSLLRKRKFILITVPLIAVIITYFLVRSLPDTYVSRGRIATGLVDETNQQFLDKQAGEQESKINQQFANLIQTMQLKKMFDQISYTLILHDLTSNTPYHKLSKTVNDLNKEAKKHAIEVYSQKYVSREPLSLWDQDQNGLNLVIKSMGYDDISIKKKLSIYRVGSSDFIDIEFESDNPMLSAVVINTLCQEFITYYAMGLKENQTSSVNFLDSLLRTKKLAMTGEQQNLQGYKIQNKVLNVNDETSSLYTQIADYESKKQLNQKDIIAYTAGIKAIDDKFNVQDKKKLDNSITRINQGILQTKELLTRATNQYIKSNYDERYKSSIDSLQNLLTLQISQSNDNRTAATSPAKDNLVTQRMNLEVSLEIAKNSATTIDQELVRLNQKLATLVPHGAVIQSHENALDAANKDYNDILQKFNQTSILSNLPIKLRQIEIAMPGTKQASKKIILIIVSGLLTFVFCIIVFFILFYLDRSIHVPHELVNQTELPVLGFLPFVQPSLIDMKEIWEANENDKVKSNFKKLLNSVRFEVYSEMKDSKLLMVTSLASGEGKTLFSLSLAYAYFMINKKVLLIDGNFESPKIKSAEQSALFLDDYLNNKISLQEISKEGSINILSSRGGDISLFELSNEINIKEKLEALKSAYDIVIIEISSLNTLNKAKEWILFADKLIAVFEANQTLSFSKKQQIDYLRFLDHKFIGWVLNKTINSTLLKES